MADSRGDPCRHLGRNGSFHQDVSGISIPRRTVAALARQEIDRVGKEMAAERGLTNSPSGPGE
jgi:hypothetical protein